MYVALKQRKHNEDRKNISICACKRIHITASVQLAGYSNSLIDTYTHTRPSKYMNDVFENNYNTVHTFQ